MVRQGIHQRQGELIGGAAVIGVRPLPQTCGGIEQTLRLGTVKDEGPPRGRTAPGLDLRRRLAEHLVEDEPIEETTQRTQQGVEAPGVPGPLRHEDLQ